MLSRRAALSVSRQIPTGTGRSSSSSSSSSGSCTTSVSGGPCDGLFGGSSASLSLLIRIQNPPLQDDHLENLPPPFLCPTLAERTHSRPDRQSLLSTRVTFTKNHRRPIASTSSVKLETRCATRPLPTWAIACSTRSWRPSRHQSSSPFCTAVRYRASSVLSDGFSGGRRQTGSLGEGGEGSKAFGSFDAEPPPPPPHPQRHLSPSKWATKQKPNPWSRGLDFNRYAPPLPVREEEYPATVPRLSGDDITEGTDGWSPPESETETQIPKVPRQNELSIILDTLGEVIKSEPDEESLGLINEAMDLASETFFGHGKDPARLTTPEERRAALMIVGKAAEAYIHLDDERVLDTVMKLLTFTLKEIGPLPIPYFRILLSRLGRQGRYFALLKMFGVSLKHHQGGTDEWMLYARLRAYTATEFFERIERYWEVYDDFEGRKLQVPRYVFDFLLRTYIRRGEIAKVNEVLTAMVERGHEVTAETWLVILRGRLELRPKLVNLLQREPDLEIKPSLKVLNDLLRLQAKSREVHSFLETLQLFQVPMDGVPISETRPSGGDTTTRLVPLPLPKGALPDPDAETYSICAQLFGHLGRPREALSFFRLSCLAKASITATEDPSPETETAEPTKDERTRLPMDKTPIQERKRRGYHLQHASTAVIQAFNLAFKPHAGLSFASFIMGLPDFHSVDTSADFSPESFSDLEKVSPSSLHYKAMLECSATLRDAEVARSILLDMFSRDMYYNGRIRMGISKLVFSAVNGNTSQMRWLLRQLTPRDPTEMSEDVKPVEDAPHESDRRDEAGPSASSTRLASTDEATGNSQKEKVETYKRALRLAKVLDSKGLSDKAVLSTGSGVAKTTARRAKEDEMRRWMMENPLEPDSQGVYRTAVENQTDLSVPLSPAGYAMRMRVYAVTRKDYSSAQALYRSMIGHGIRPNMLHIAPLVEGLIGLGKLEDAQTLKRNAVKICGTCPTLRIHTALIRAYLKNGNEEDLSRELEEMRASGLQADELLRSILDDARSGPGRRRGGRNRRRDREAEADEILSRPINLLDNQVVTSRFKSLLAIQAYLEAQKLIESALDQGLEPDGVTRREVMRSENYIRKMLEKAKGWWGSEGEGSADSSDNANEGGRGVRDQVSYLERAHKLAEENRERSQKARSGSLNKERKRRWEYRESVVALVKELSSGHLKRVAKERAREGRMAVKSSRGGEGEVDESEKEGRREKA
ncbi:hypothetical protein IE53DRAFT_388175 [Violaceomyces palustris]|uniref:Uncharacterized protein n=1 Tax=Violaceomyces palustris TaxID=1673888 RepID=A0ACD0NUU3_9BASI|nr:hypothetical protein IE53DRAFT_388175 [Violaceomyces palustris]